VQARRRPWLNHGVRAGRDTRQQLCHANTTLIFLQHQVRDASLLSTLVY
jgi:hypothetical protein